MRHLISLFDVTDDDVIEILDISDFLKRELKRGNREQRLNGYCLAQIFEKPSLRTRNSFETAMIHLGGAGIFLSGKDAGLHGRESIADIARVLSSYSDIVVLRTFSHALIQNFAEYCTCPVINGLSDDFHPCQALTDILTMREVYPDLAGRRLAYIGDGNNVAKSLAIATGLMRMSMVIAAPPDYQLSNSFLADVKEHAPQADVTQVTDPAKAVRDADVVYTDVWASMGQESEADARKKVFAPYQVNSQLMSKAPKDCRFMHDLPARRGLEVTDDVIDSKNSIVFQQAENRMHLAKGLMIWLLEKMK